PGASAIAAFAHPGPGCRRTVRASWPALHRCLAARGGSHPLDINGPIRRRIDHLELITRHGVDARVASQFSTLELQAPPIRIEVARLVFKLVQLYEQLARLEARGHQGKRRNHQQRGKQNTEAAHRARPFCLPGDVCATNFIALTNEAPWSGGNGVAVRSATRSTAERARTFCFASSSVGKTRPSERSEEHTSELQS